MSYQSQLVVRTNDANECQVLDQVRALAEARGETLSSTAMFLLRRGLEAGAAEPTSPAIKDVAVAKPAEKPRAKPAPKKAPQSNGRERVTVPQASGVVREYLTRLDESGDAHALEAIAGFFAVAGPAEVFDLKAGLKKALLSTDYEALMSSITSLEIYQDYKRRALSR